MPNFVLLTGAGFSKNWGGFLAREITNALMSQLQSKPYLLDTLNRGNFEDALSLVQSEYINSGTAENRSRVDAMQEALKNVFGGMNTHFAATPFEFSNDIAHSIQKFLVRFDAIFTLNQDLLIEVRYDNQNVAIWYGTRWQGYALPGLRELPSEDPLPVECGPSGCHRSRSCKHLTCSHISSSTARPHGPRRMVARSW